MTASAPAMTGRKLNIGSGTVRLPEGFENIDSNPDVTPDIVAHVPPIPAGDGECSVIVASHFMEHLSRVDRDWFMREVHRVLEPGGVLEVVVPYGLSHGGLADPTHQSVYVPESFLYYTEQYAYLQYDLPRFEMAHFQWAGNDPKTPEIHVQMRKVVLE